MRNVVGSAMDGHIYIFLSQHFHRVISSKANALRMRYYSQCGEAACAVATFMLHVLFVTVAELLHLYTISELLRASRA